MKQYDKTRTDEEEEEQEETGQLHGLARLDALLDKASEGYGPFRPANYESRKAYNDLVTTGQSSYRGKDYTLTELPQPVEEERQPLGPYSLTQEAEARRQAAAGVNRAPNAYQTAMMQAMNAEPAASETRSNTQLRRDANRQMLLAYGTNRMSADMGNQLLQNPSLVYNPTYTTNLRAMGQTMEAQQNKAVQAQAHYQTVKEQRKAEEAWSKYSPFLENPDFLEKSKPDLSNENRVYYSMAHSKEAIEENGANVNAAAYATDDEKRMYYYLWNTKGSGAANAYYYNYVEHAASARKAVDVELRTAARVQNNGFLGDVRDSFKSIGTNAISGIGLVDIAFQNIGAEVSNLLGLGDPGINYYSLAQMPGIVTDSIRSNVAKKIAESTPGLTIGKAENAVNVASFLYETGMSMADSTAMILMNLAGVPEWLTLGSMGASAGTRAVRDAKERGASDWQALAFGISSAIMEALFEKVSLDHILKPSDGKFFKNAAKQTFVEGSEEFFTTWGNTMMDQIIMGDKSELFTRERQLMEQGYSQKDALNKAALEWCIQIGTDAFAGMISGFGMGGAKEVGTGLGDFAQGVRQDMQTARALTDYQNAQQAAPQITQQQPPAAPVQQRQLTEREQNPLQFAMNKAQNGETVTGNDAKAILNDPQAVQTLRDAGVLADTIRPGAEGRAQIQQAVQALAEQTRAETPETQRVTERTSQLPVQNQQETAQERTTPPLPRQVAQEQQERVTTPPVPQNTQEAAQEPTLRLRAQEEQAPRQETLRIRENEVTEPTQQAPLTIRGANATVEENRQEESYGQGQQTETAAAAGEDDFRARAETAAEGARRSYLDRIERSSGLGRVLQDLRNYRLVRGAESRASEVSRIRNQAEAGNQREVSAQDYGISNGSAEQSAKELDNATASRVLGRNWDRAVAELARQGVTLKAMTGQLKKEDGTQVRAFFSGERKTIVVQADHPKLSWNQLLDHEDLHRRIKADKNYRKAVEDALLADRKLQAYLPEIIDRYAQAYARLAPGLSSDDVIEELLADYRAGFDMLDPLGMNPITARAAKRAAKDIKGVEKERYKTNGGRPAPKDITETFAEGKNSVEPPYRFGTKALADFEESLSPEARKTYDLFKKLTEISRAGTAVITVGSGKAAHLKRDTIADKSFFAKDWNKYVKNNEEFAETARKLVAALPKSVKDFGHFNDDGTITPTEFEENFKMNRSFVQRVVDALPKNVVQPVMTIDGHEYRISDNTISGAVGGEEYRQAILAEKRRLYKEGNLPTVSVGSLSHDNWGAMGFLATNTKTGASGDFTTFCPQMYFNNGCFYCYRRAALTSGSNNKLTGETVWYSGEILQLTDKDKEALNKRGGLRIQSFGDWQDMYTPMLADMLYDAQLRGLQIKIITKEPSMIETVARLRKQALGLSLYFNLSADYTIERRGESDNREVRKAAPLNAERPFLEHEWLTGEPGEDIGWKRALSVQEANEYRKKYSWVNTRIVATTLKEYLRGLIDPTVDVVTGYHGKIKYQERVSSETGETLIEMEALGDSGMPQFKRNEQTGEWEIARDKDGKPLNGKNHYQKELCNAIVERGLQEAYYAKACCITGRCAECQGLCGGTSNQMSTKNATNRDADNLRWVYLQMEAHPGAGMEGNQLFAENVDLPEGTTQAEDLVDIYDREHGIKPLQEKSAEQALAERDKWLKKKDSEAAKKAAKAAAEKAGATPAQVEANGKYSTEVNMLTYFSGGGLVDHALRDVIGSSMAVEYDKGAAAVYALNNGDVFVGDVRDFSKTELKKMKGVEYFHASPVCKNYSRMNIRRNQLSDNNTDITTAQATADAIREMDSLKVFTLEQVPEYDGSAALKIITDTLDELGYTWDTTIANAHDYGGATSRERLMLRAVKNGELPALPEKTGGYTWFEATADLITGLESKERLSPFMQERIDRTPELKAALRNQTEPILMLGGTPGGKAWWAPASDPCPSITTDMQDARILMPDGTIRKPDARFFARIMGMPDSYQFTQYRGKDNQTQGQKVIGNGVPVQLTQKFFGNLLDSALDTDVKYSTEIDTDYLAAVNSGDMETAQRMVDEAAKKAGYTVRKYHQTNVPNIHVFDIGIGTHGGTDSETPYGIFTKNTRADIGLGDIQMSLYLKPGKTFVINSRDELRSRMPDAYNLLSTKLEAIDAKYNALVEEAEDALFDAQDAYEEKHPEAEVTLDDIVNNRTYDDPACQRANEHWKAVMAEWSKEADKIRVQAKEVLSKYLRDSGYDSMEIKLDKGTNGRSTDTFIVFSPEQVKSADPVTYDDNGKVIPLSQRFNTRNEDTRFSREIRPEVVDRLDKQIKDGNYVIVYHSLYQDKDGNLYSPMAGKKKVGDKWVMTNPYDLNAWYKSDAPENIADLIENGTVKLKDSGGWSFLLKKPDAGGTDVPAALNPWNHASTDALNDQFNAAFARETDEGELVTVESIIPLSEVDPSVAVDPETGKVETKPYEELGMVTDRDVVAKPDSQNKKLKVPTNIPAGTTIKPKDSVGLKMWKAGPVHGQISGKRPVYLSRWIRNTRVLSTAETAKMIAKTLKDENFSGTIPGNVVGLKLRQALENEGVKFGTPTNKGYYAYMAERGYTKSQAEGEPLSGSTSIEIDPEVAAQFSPEAIARRQSNRTKGVKGERKVSRVRSNTYEYSGLYNEVEAQMDEADEENYTYDPVSEKKSMNEALGRLKADFDGEVSRLSEADRQWGGSDLDTAMGILHRYRTEGRATGDYGDFWRWSKVIQEKGTKGGQFIQAFAKYTRTGTGAAMKGAKDIHDRFKLNPAQQKQVDAAKKRLMDGIDGDMDGAAQDAMKQAKGQKEPSKKQDGKVDKKKLEAEAQRRKDAERLVREISKLFEKQQNHGEPVENWLNLTGEELARKIAGRFSEPKSRTKTTMQTILSDLVGFAEEHALPDRKKAEGTKRTAIDIITDYLNNRDAYGTAWAAAQSYLRAAYTDDQEKLDALNSFLTATIAYNAEGTDKTVLDAILQSADVLGISEKRILELTSAGATASTIDRIGNELVNQVKERMGADYDESFTQQLKDAVRRHITGIALQESAEDQRLRLSGMTTDAARQLELNLQKLLTQSRGDKNRAAQSVADYLIRELGIPSSDAAIAADRITGAFMDELASRADRKLQQMFAEKKPRTQEQRDRLLDLIRLGGLTNSNVEDAVVDALGIGGMSRERQRELVGVMAQFGETLDAMEADDLDGLKDLIRAQAAVRNTPLSRQAEKALAGETDAQYLREFALAQLDAIAGDFAEMSLGAKISTFQTISHLLNMRTALRNLTSNQVFDLVDSAANNLATIPDMVIGAFTGKRTVGVNKSWLSEMKRAGAKQGAARNALEVRLDVSPDDRQKSKYGTAGRRTNSMAASNAFGRILSHLEEVMGYELNATDEFHKGSVRGETLESLARFVERGDITQEQANAWAEEEALYRSFQDDTLVGNIMGELKTLLNVIGFGDSGKTNSRGRTIHDFGLGDLVVKYTQVPGALIHRGIEYSPLGYAKMLYDLAIAKDSLVRTQRRGEDVTNAQRKLALDIGRATTGSGLITLFAVLAKAGLLRRDDDDKDKNAKAMHAAQGLSGTQLNLTALKRWIEGGDLSLTDGDVLADIGFLEPLDSLMTIATLMANDDDLKLADIGVKSLDGVWKAISNTSAMQTISNIISTVQYHDEENDLPLYFQIPIEIASDSISGFVPSPVRQLAQATDTTYRDQYRSKSLNDQVRAKVMNSVPGVRQMLAPKITPLGEDKKYQKPLLNYLNATLNPGNINVYQASDVVDELNRVYGETDDAKIWPERNAPYSFTMEEEKYTLTPDERTQYQRTRGQQTNAIMEAVMGTDWYKAMGATDQADVLNWIGNFSNYIAKKEMLAGRGVDAASKTYDKYYEALMSGTSPEDVVASAKSKVVAAAEETAAAVEIIAEAKIPEASKAEAETMSAEAKRYYAGFLKGGVSDETARKLAAELEGSETSGHEQWRMVYDSAGKEGEKAVTSVMTDDMKRNWDLAKGVGVSMDDYIKVREGFKDLNGNGNKSQDEWNATLDSFTFSTNTAKDKSIKGTLWQILTGSGSTKNNPYDKEAGQKVIDAKAKGGSGSGSYAPARIPTLRIPAAPTVSKPSSGLRIRAMTPAAQAPRSGLRIKAQ